jgi:hypothetical protein
MSSPELFSPPAPDKPHRNLRTPLTVGGAVLALILAIGAGMAGTAIGHQQGESAASASYAARPTPIVTSVTTAPPITKTETVTVAPPVAPTMTMTGAFELQGSENWVDSAGGCSGEGGFNDLTGGASVIVYDATGGYAGAGSLDAGTVSGTSCLFTIEVSGIAAGSNVYLAEVSHRGKIKVYQDGDTLTFGGTIGS